MQTDSQEYKDLVKAALAVPLSERQRIAKDAVSLMETKLSEANKQVQALIPEAANMPITNGMHPSVFMAIKLDGQYHVGINYQPKGTTVGHEFHYDHGAGITRNTDAMVHWIK